jgi:hypothetical protein
MMPEIKLPFGQTPEGRMVSIDAVVRGLDCECVCPECKTALVAVKGKIYQHHFRHYSTACEHAAETALHLFAKQCIRDQPHLFRLPGGVNLGRISTTESEHRLPSGIVPDVFIEFIGFADVPETVAIEVWVAHQVPLDKVEIYNRDEQTAIEIDLRRYRLTAKNEEQWREVVLSTAPRSWLCPHKALRMSIANRRANKLAMEEARLAHLQQKTLLAEVEVVEAQRAAEAERLADARRAAIRQAQEVERQQERVRRAKQEAQRRYAQAVVEERLLREMQPPSLQDMVADHGGYHRITPEAWAAYDEAMLIWQSRHEGGDFWRPPYLALQRQKERLDRPPSEADIQD